MTPDKKQTPTAASSRTAPASGMAAGRKPWVRKTPADIVITQIDKQEQRVAELEEQLKTERRELEKLQRAKEVLLAK